jgi:hypothetical protein
MTQNRVQVGDLRRDNTLRPAPIQSDTFARPAAIPQDYNTARLAEALGSFSNNLGNLVPVLAASDKKASEDASERALAMEQRRIGSMSLSDWRKEADQGNLSVLDDKYKNAALQSYRGNKYAESLAADADEHMRTNFDWQNGNADEYLAHYFGEAAQKFPSNDPNFIGSVSKGWDSYKSRVREQQQTYRVNQVNQDTVDTAFGVIKDKTEEWISKGQKPEIFARNLNRMRGELGIQGPLGADGSVLDKEYLNAADRLATTHPEYAIAMVDAEYDGRGGKTSLSAQREYRDRVLNIKAEAAKAIGKREDGNTLLAVDTQADALLTDDHLDRVTDFTYTDHNGEQKTVSAKTIKDEALNRYILRSPQIAKDNQETPAQTRARELRKAQLSGLDHPALKAAVSGIASAASPDLAQDPQALGTFMEKVNIARWLQNTSKNTYMAYTTEADRDFMESFNIAKNTMTEKDGRQFSDNAALDFAMRTSQPLSVDGLNFTRDQNDKIDRSVKYLATTPGWLWGTNSATPWNSAAGQNRVANMAKRLVRGGMDQDKAIDVATESVKRNSVTYNGMLLDVGKTALPDNYSQTLDGILGDFAKANPGVLKDRGIDPSDLTIQPLGDINVSGGRFQIIDKETGTSVMDDKSGLPFYISLQSIRDRSKSDAHVANAKAAANSSINGVAEARGLNKLQEDGKTIWHDPKTNETFDINVSEAGGNPKVTNLGRRKSPRSASDQGTFNEGIVNPASDWLRSMREDNQAKDGPMIENLRNAGKYLGLSVPGTPQPPQKTKRRNTAR